MTINYSTLNMAEMDSSEREYFQNIFDKYVEKGSIHQCWYWGGTEQGINKTWKNAPSGYGHFIYNKHTIYAHRLGYVLENGFIPEKAEIMHTCDNPLCVNPNHLRAGSHKENMADCVSKGRIPHGEKSGKASLTEDEVKFMRLKFSRVKTYLEKSILIEVFSKMYNKPKKSLYQIRSGITWKYITSTDNIKTLDLLETRFSRHYNKVVKQKSL